MIEIFDGVLQFLEHVLLTLAVAGDIGHRPDSELGLPLFSAQWPNAHPQPSAMRRIHTCDADFLLLALAFASSLEQTEHRFRDIRIADEDALHRPHVVRTGRTGEREIGRVGVDDVAARVRYRQPVERVIGDGARDRIFREPVGKADDPGGESKQREQPDHGQQSQQRQNIRLRLTAPEGHESNRRGDDRACHQQHKQDAPSAPRRLMDGGEG